MSNHAKYTPEGVPEPWERQAGEPTKAWEAFVMYRDLPPKERSVRRVGEMQGKRWVSYMEDWSAKWQWVERAGQFDAYKDKQKRDLAEQERKEMSELHIKAARAMLTKALQALKAIPAEEMSASDITKMVEVSSRLERLSRGESTDSVESYGREDRPSAVQIYLPSNGREDTE